ncbi:MAG: hypothetical protein M9951_05700 [Burkholderiaceae bacterium]|nr:hypothetical protein [Burkholderiaceae bacterium]MEB2318501.1 hypothetical protein [Pseudomonadota bacterium]
MIRNLLLFAAAALAACASSDSPTPGEAPLVVARVERVAAPVSMAASPVFDALGPIGLALRALAGEGGYPREAILLTQTGERVQLALGPSTGRLIAAGDCVGVLPVDTSAGLRAHYRAGEARLAPSRDCGQLGK